MQPWQPPPWQPNPYMPPNAPLHWGPQEPGAQAPPQQTQSPTQHNQTSATFARATNSPKMTPVLHELDDSIPQTPSSTLSSLSIPTRKAEEIAMLFPDSFSQRVPLRARFAAPAPQVESTNVEASATNANTSRPRPVRSAPAAVRGITATKQVAQSILVRVNVNH